ncbi:MAG: MATE family efflux transporter, partial [Janthinobacterium lividum]
TGMATGAGDPRRVRRVGLVAIGLTVLVMAGIGLGLLLTPRLVTGLFLDPGVAGNRAALRLAVTLLGIAALFQIADGVQAVAIGALRGMGDSSVPMVLATVGYWLVGAPLGWLLGFRLGFGVVGLWVGLAGALVSVAVMMTARFVLTTRCRHAEMA